MVQEQQSFFLRTRYIVYFILRSFLIALLCLVIGAFFLFSLYFGDLFINVKTGNYKSPIFSGYIIVSPSMVPTIKINDAIFVKRESNDKYSIGDIISFFSTEYDSNGMVITHRIVDKKSESLNKSKYKTKGDNNSIADRESVYTDNIYGKVLFILPKLGYIQHFLSKPINFIFSIIIPALFIIVIDFARVGIIFGRHNRSN